MIENVNSVQGNEFVVNNVGDPCSICGGDSAFIPIQDELDVTYWICEAYDAPIE